MNRKNAIIAVLSILLILSVSTSLHLHHQEQRVITAQKAIIAELSRMHDTGSRAIAGTSAFINVSEGTRCAKIVAVRSDNNLGVIGSVYVEIKSGNGNVWVNTNPFTELTTQYSVREAVKVAVDYTNINISNKDISIFFDINGSLIGGPSAGAAITVATIAAIEGKSVRQDAVITGTIEGGGYIGHVGGVLEKAEAAEKSGITLLLVPLGHKNLTYYEQKTKEYDIFGFTFTRSYYAPKEIDLGEYMTGKMEVVEVSTIDDAVRYMIR
ncbi:MAG: S16 family serine protease [Halobacteriota archaeon]